MRGFICIPCIYNELQAEISMIPGNGQWKTHIAPKGDCHRFLYSMAYSLQQPMPQLTIDKDSNCHIGHVMIIGIILNQRTQTQRSPIYLSTCLLYPSLSLSARQTQTRIQQRPFKGSFSFQNAIMFPTPFLYAIVLILSVYAADITSCGVSSHSLSSPILHPSSISPPLYSDTTLLQQLQTLLSANQKKKITETMPG
jgi:hypothetical protein